MTSDPFIAETMRRRIEAELAAIERSHDVHILLAIESGSRAWRFPSQDSDYDVRFVYIHRMDSYLSVEPLREVIELPIDGALDISGWDLRKALRLLVYSNAVLFEWLASPERYRETEIASVRIRSLAEESCFLPALIYHYDRMARHSFEEIVASGDSISFKTYCYALRPSLALLWIRRYGAPPPMDLQTLLSRDIVARDVQESIMELVDRKAVTIEQSRTPRMETLDSLIAGVLTETASRFKLPDRALVLSKANALFASLLRGEC
jgi:predicted nucleotidyltransferase